MTKTILAALLLLAATNAAMAEHDWAGRDIDTGQRLYAENCASCHGTTLEGHPDWRSLGPDGAMQAPPHDETGHTWHHPSAYLFYYTKLGGEEAMRQMGTTGVKSGMPAFGETLTDAQILDTLAYIRSTWPDQARTHQDRVSHGG